jgi:WD40 repeat protein
MSQMSLKMNKNNSSALFHSQYQLLGHNGPIYALSLDSDFLYSAASDKLVVRWNLLEGVQDHFVVKTERPAFSILKSVLNDELIIGLDNGSLHVIDVQLKQELRHLKAHTSAIFSIAEHPKNGHRYSTDADGNLFIWDTAWNLVLQMPLACGKIRNLVLSQDAQFLFLACADGSIKVFDTEFYNLINDWLAHPEGCTTLCFLPDQTLLSAGKDAHIRHWHSDGTLLKGFPAHKGTIYGIAALKNHAYVSVSRDKTIKIWDALTQQIIQKIEVSGKAHLHSINAVQVYHGKFISAGDDKRIHVWTT